jgi:hypothetical protein
MRPTLLLALLLVAGCKSTDPTPNYSMTGSWTVQSALSGTFTPAGGATGYSVSCTGRASVSVFENENGQLVGHDSGDLTCVNPEFGTVSATNLSGQLSGTHQEGIVMMVGSACRYSGKMSSTTSAAGNLGCSITDLDGAGGWGYEPGLSVPGILQSYGTWTTTEPQAP